MESEDNDMKCCLPGSIEGLVLTTVLDGGWLRTIVKLKWSLFLEYEIFKLKGPQEHQPATIAHFLLAAERIEKSEEINQDVKKTFKLIADIISDTSENVPAQKTKKKMDKVMETGVGKRKYLSKSDKEGTWLIFSEGFWGDRF